LPASRQRKPTSRTTALAETAKTTRKVPAAGQGFFSCYICQNRSTLPAYDYFHAAFRNALINALIKDGWTITDDPLTLCIGERKLFEVTVENGKNRVLPHIW
jgi:hypothetical protein